MARGLVIVNLALPIVLVGVVACDDGDDWGRGHPVVSRGHDTPPDAPLSPELSGIPTEEGLRVAFLSDQGLGVDAAGVLDLVRDEGADFLVIAGDFDYNDDPSAWDDQTVASLGENYPMFAVAGNHDENMFAGANGYQSKIITRMQNAIDDGAICTGEPGRNSACSYKGLFMAMSGVDVLDTTEASAEYLRGQLAANDAIWSVCVWHKNMNDMQVGGKFDDTDWGVYQACQDEAGIVITGHEHSYSRTRTLTDLGNEPGGHGATGAPGLMVVGQGSTYVSVVGLGGRSIRDYEANLHDDDTWWASIYTTNFYLKNGEVVDDWNAEFGALFIDFNVDGDPHKAHAYFKSVNGAIVDEYEIIRESGGGGDGDGDGDGDGGGPTQLVITSFDDTFVKSKRPEVNFGDDKTLRIAGQPGHETFIKPLGLDVIPPNAMIEAATLRLYSSNTGATAEAWNVIESWAENTLTYNNRPNSSGPFTSFATTAGWVEIDVTSTVQAWTGGEPVYGIRLRSDGNKGSSYYSTEYGSNQPELLISYMP